MKKLFFYAITTAIVFIVSFAVICPSINLQKIVPVSDSVLEMNADDGKIISAGTIAKNGDITVNEQTPCVVEYEISASDICCVKIDFKDEVGGQKSFAIENTVDGTFTDKPVAYANMRKGDDTVCVGFEKDEYKAIRIWYHESCNVEKISYYNVSPSAVRVPLRIEAWRYLLVSAITVLAFALTFSLDKFLNISERIFDFFKNRKKRIVMFLIGVICALALAALADIIFRWIFGPDSIGNMFNKATFGIFASITVSAFIFFFERKNIATKPERLVALIVLAAGFLIILTEPFSHNSSDEDSHYYYAVQNSFYKDAHLSYSDYCVKNTVDFSVAKNIESSMKNVSVMNERDGYADTQANVYNSLPHRLAGAFIAVARLFGASFRIKFVLGQFGMLFIYATTVYFAIRKLKNGKMIMSVIALFPTSILLAANYSYDAWVTGFSLLGIAYFISELEQPQKDITVWETVIMCGALMLAALPKLIYCLLMLLPLFMKKEWTSKWHKQRYFIILLTFFAAILVSFIITSSNAITSAGDLRGGEVDPMGQFVYILSNPIEYAKKLIKFLIQYLSPLNANKYITFFSYLGNGKTAVVFLIVLCFCSLTDKGEENRFKGYKVTKILALIFIFGIVCLIATALYISFTPVAHETINGCNPRYLIPLIAPVALTICNPGIKCNKNNAIYNFSVLAICSVCLIFDIITVVAVPMM